MTPEDAALVERYPLRVDFPTLSGFYYLLFWYNDDERTMMLMGRSEEGVLDAYKATLKTNHRYDAKPLSLHYIEIVAPSDRVKIEHALRERDGDKASFAYSVGRLLDQTKMLPIGVRRCSLYMPKDEEDRDDEYRCDMHSGCTICHGTKYAFDVEKIFTEKYDMFREVQGYGPVRPQKILARTTSNPFCAVSGGYSHHSEGSAIVNVHSASDVLSQPAFFCEQIRWALPPPPAFIDAFKEAQNRSENEDREFEARSEKIAAEMKQKDIDLVKALFDCTSK